jgi:hypothetical protein
MSGGMILKDATIFGQSGGTLLGGGEAGDEAVVGVSSLRSMIQDAVSSMRLCRFQATSRLSTSRK